LDRYTAPYENPVLEGRRVFDLDPSRQFDIFDYPEFDVTIVGFSSFLTRDSGSEPMPRHGNQRRHALRQRVVPVRTGV
jgi:hypothetical protein